MPSRAALGTGERAPWDGPGSAKDRACGVFARLGAVVCALFLTLGQGAMAQEFSALARLDVAQSQVVDDGAGLTLDLYLSQPVPFRIFTLDAPRRLVLDFREVDFRGATRAGMLNADGATDLRFGPLRPGWSRMVVDLAGPKAVTSAGMEVDEVVGTAHLVVRLDPASEEAFAEAAGAPPDPDWALIAADPTLPPPAPPEEGGPLIVVIDPGHGGIDPGAEHAGVRESDLMLTLGLELAEAVTRSGMRAVLTRNSDVFVPLSERLTIARNAGADVFLSLHADALEGEQARGASIYTLSEDATDRASERMAERHNRGDLLAGMDLSQEDDTIAKVLMDLARIETGPAGERLSEALVAALLAEGAVVNNRPQRQAMLAVLLSADFPSVLVEVGFLSNPADRERLTTAEGRATVVAGLVRGLQVWAAEEEALAPLIRQ